MKLDTTTKIVTLVSLIVGIMISVAGYFTGLKFQSLDARLKALDATDKGMDVSNKAYNLSPRLITEFKLPLARTFAEDYTNNKTGDGGQASIPIPTAGQRAEFAENIPRWITRKGLMTGSACDGLNIRQVITLTIKNIGSTDAIGIKIKALQKASPTPSEPAAGWQEMSANGAVPYYELHASSKDWKTVTFEVDDLLGQNSPESDRNESQIVLASISGEKTFYGTVLVPIEISWTDSVTKVPQARRIMESKVSKLRSSLLGAEVGTACPQKNQ